MTVKRAIRKIAPLWGPNYHNEPFELLWKNMILTGACRGQLELTKTGRVQSVIWNGSPLVYGDDPLFRRFMAVKTETREYIYRDDSPERIIDFTSWYVLLEKERARKTMDKMIVCGVYGDQDLERFGLDEPFRFHSLLHGGQLVYQTPTDNFLVVQAGREYLEALDE